MPVTVRFNPTANSEQAAIIPNVSQRSAGVMSPGMFAQLQGSPRWQAFRFTLDPSTTDATAAFLFPAADGNLVPADPAAGGSPLLPARLIVDVSLDGDSNLSQVTFGNYRTGLFYRNALTSKIALKGQTELAIETDAGTVLWTCTLSVYTLPGAQFRQAQVTVSSAAAPIQNPGSATGTMTGYIVPVRAAT